MKCPFKEFTCQSVVQHFKALYRTGVFPIQIKCPQEELKGFVFIEYLLSVL